MPRAPRETSNPSELDAVIVGAGFAGMFMLHRLRGLGLEATVFESGTGVGGTWHWNRYPGARCDIESMEYSYQFSDELQQEWEWTERYATQPEILRYANHVADRFDLRRDIQLETRVESATFDEATDRWTIRTSRGELSARYFILATGCLSSTNTPDFEGLEAFEGPVLHTGQWPHEGVDFTGQTVGIIGTGSSAIQSIPLIAEQADHLTVFQRTANFSVPAHNDPLDPAYVAKIKANYATIRDWNYQMPLGFGVKYLEMAPSALEATPEERQASFEKRWRIGGLPFIGAFNDLLVVQESNDFAGDFIRGKIREIVDDPETAELLSPKQVVGCKRLCVDTGYYATFNRANVSLVDVGEAPIEKITPTGLVTGGKAYDFDCLILATGFDAMTGAISKIEVRGRGGRTLEEKWAEGPRTYLGLGVEGFPNLFTITGPGSPSVLSNMLPSIEQHVEWIAQCLGYLGEHGVTRIEADLDAEDAWVQHVNEVAELSLFPHCNSWYLGANIPGKPRVFMPYLGVPTYIEKCNEVAGKGYEGFTLTRGGAAESDEREGLDGVAQP